MRIRYDARITLSRAGDDGLLRFDAALDLLQDCEQFGADSIWEYTDWQSAHNISMFLVYRQLRVTRLPEYGTDVQLVTYPYQCDRIFGKRYCVMTNDKNETLVESWVSGAYVELTTGAAVRVPLEITQSVELHEAPEPPFKGRKVVFPADADFQTLKSGIVRYRDTDKNGHMNNARYLEYALTGKTFSAVRVEYRQPAKRGDTYEVSRSGEFAKLTGTDGAEYARIEFQD
jgi:medium-chain acyl-[acyl-carrier-protein] hydrolase